LLFTQEQSGPARRVEGFVSHLLQRRGNHESFRLRTIDADSRPDLFERFHVEQVPTLVVIDEQRVQCRLNGYVRPRQLEDALAEWLK
jgi:hypothetical protein